MKSLMVGMAVWRQIEAGTVKALLNLQAKALLQGVSFALVIAQGDALVSRARSRLATGFVKSRCDVLLMLDGDILFEPSEALAMCLRAHEMDAVVAGMYVTRSDPPQPASQLPVGRRVVFGAGLGTELVEAPYAAGGFMAIARPVVEALKPTVEVCREGAHGFENYFGPFVHESAFLSEDYAFCHRVRAAGMGVFIDPSVRLGHVGEHVYRIDDLLEPPGWRNGGRIALTLGANRELTAEEE